MHVLKNPEFRMEFDRRVMKADPSGQLKEFIDWLESRKLLYNTDTHQMEMEFGWKDYDRLPTVFIKSPRLELMILDNYQDRVAIGVDAGGCFDKINRCAIRAYLPMKRHSVKELTDQLDKIIKMPKWEYKEFEDFSAHFGHYDDFD